MRAYLAIHGLWVVLLSLTKKKRHNRNNRGSENSRNLTHICSEADGRELSAGNPAYISIYLTNFLLKVPH